MTTHHDTNLPQGNIVVGLRAARVRAGMSVVELAEAVNLSRRTISRLENGRHPGSYAAWVRLSEALKTPIRQLRAGNVPEWEMDDLADWPEPDEER